MAKRAPVVSTLIVLAACSNETPTEPATRPALVLSYSGPCGWGEAVVSVDGTVMGRVRIPGALSLPLDPGSHQLQVGTSPSVPFAMPADRDLLLTNVPSACP